jgi:hypothetical protein
MMIDALSKGLNQKPAMIKGAPPVTPSRAFGLWLALLVLYFLLLPSAAQTSYRGEEYSADAGASMPIAPQYRPEFPFERH